MKISIRDKVDSLSYITGLALVITLVTYFVNFDLGNKVFAISFVVIFIIMYIQSFYDPTVPKDSMFYRLFTSIIFTTLLLSIFVLAPLVFSIIFFSNTNEIPIHKVDKYNIYDRYIVTEYNGKTYSVGLRPMDLYRLEHKYIYPYIVKRYTYLFDKDNIINEELTLDLIKEVENGRECDTH